MSVDKFPPSHSWEVQCSLRGVHILNVTCSLLLEESAVAELFCIPLIFYLFWLNFSTFSEGTTMWDQSLNFHQNYSQKTFVCVADFTEKLEAMDRIDTTAIQKQKQNLTEYLMPLSLKSFVHLPSRKFPLSSYDLAQCPRISISTLQEAYQVIFLKNCILSLP